MSFISQSVWLVAILLAFVSLTVATDLSTVEMPMSARYEKWMAQYGLVYKDAEEKAHRFEIFKANAEYVLSVNREGNRTYRLGLNRFADLTNEEFKASYLGFKPKPSAVKEETKVEQPFTYANLDNMPSEMDWRDHGAVTGVKNQNPCGSCWAFSSVAVIESIVKIKTGQLMSLSEQEVLDCTGKGSCQGGNMEEAYKFVIRNGGLTTESNYPYTKKQGLCNSKRMSASAATISGYQMVQNSEAALLNAVANQPVSVALEGSGKDFQFYKGGLFTGYCGNKLDHAVAVVGYGSSAGTNYWLVKNSWGSDWGEAGYMQMQRDIGSDGGLCGITLYASYPTV
ncbi:senescence-specific cysteine protease SAG39-like [Carex rostrata]